MRNIWDFLMLPYRCIKHGIPSGYGIAAAIGKFYIISGLVLSVATQVFLVISIILCLWLGLKNV